MAFGAEAELYPAVKAFLEARGYHVKGEIRGCDLVATRGSEPPVIVELKLSFNLSLVLQGVDRLSLTDRVYLAVAAPRRRRPAGVSVYRRAVRGLCRRLGLGLMTVTPGRGGRVEVVLEPRPYAPRKRARHLGLLLGEHARRTGDPTRGGVSRMPIMTAYRQEALRCALLIQRDGPASLRALGATGLVPNAPRILQRDVYGWFRRVSRGTYALTDQAGQDITRFAAAGILPPLGPNGEPAGARAGCIPGPPAPP
jgi:hypothetical protein